MLMVMSLFGMMPEYREFGFEKVKSVTRQPVMVIYIVRAYKTLTSKKSIRSNEYTPAAPLLLVPTTSCLSSAFSSR